MLLFTKSLACISTYFKYLDKSKVKLRQQMFLIRVHSQYIGIASLNMNQICYSCHICLKQHQLNSHFEILMISIVISNYLSLALSNHLRYACHIGHIAQVQESGGASKQQRQYQLRDQRGEKGKEKRDGMSEQVVRKKKRRERKERRDLFNPPNHYYTTNNKKGRKYS